MNAFERLLAARDSVPRKRPADEEHQLQCACVQWFKLQFPAMRHNLFAVPNGGRRDRITGARLKAEGVKAGVADLILLRRNSQYGALLIELKTPRGSQSQAQRDWQKAIEKDGYKYVVVRSVQAFIQTINDYLDL
jgi:hypothetical protein